MEPRDSLESVNQSYSNLSSSDSFKHNGPTGCFSPPSNTSPSISTKTPDRVSIRRTLSRHFSIPSFFDELRSPLFWHDVVAETVLTAYYECLIIWISVTFNEQIYKPSITHFGLYAGFFVFMCIEGWSPLCGASVNPARTWAVLIAGRMSLCKAVIYTMVEIGGAAAGTMIAFGLTPEAARPQIIPLLPGHGVTAVQGMAIEAILTFNLILVGLVVSDPKTQPPSTMATLAIGWCVGTGVMAAGTHTGGLQNPIVAFGPAIISGNWTDHWLYWVGPYIGATVATLFYMALAFVREKYKEVPAMDRRPDKDEKAFDYTVRL